MTIILFLLVLGLLVLVHELGHFLMAKRGGVAVDEFGIGFPPKLWAKRLGETVYSLNILPLGGFVKLRGEDGTDLPDMKSLGAKSRGVQALIMVAGVVANILLAWMLLSAALFLGLPASTATVPEGAIIPDASLIITGVRAGSPAEEAGLKVGDEILTIKKANLSPKNLEAETVIEFLTKNASPVNLTYLSPNSEEVKTALITPVVGLVEDDIPAIGISLDRIGTLKLPFFSAIIEGFKFTGRIIEATVLGLGQIVKEAASGEKNILKAFVGPVGLVGLVGDASDFGLAYLLSFIAFISVNLAIFNLLPLPALDGGRLLILAIEAIIRRPLPVRFTTWLNLLGFAFLLLLMVVITYSDLVRLF